MYDFLGAGWALGVVVDSPPPKEALIKSLGEQEHIVYQLKTVFKKENLLNKRLTKPFNLERRGSRKSIIFF